MSFLVDFDLGLICTPERGMREKWEHKGFLFPQDSHRPYYLRKRENPVKDKLAELR